MVEKNDGGWQALNGQGGGNEYGHEHRKTEPE